MVEKNKASEWFVRWSDTSQPPGTGEQSRWIAWLQRSPKNVQAYMELDDMCERLAQSRTIKDFDVDGWLTGRRACVVRLADSASHQAPATYRVNRRWGRWAIAASITAVSVIVGLAWWISGGAHTYSTGLGEQNTFRLDDGSVLQLNTQSTARVAFTDHERAIELKGEGLFTVAHDPARPFLVRTRDITARALGTRFNVYEQSEATIVSVVEGAVRVSSAKTGKDIDLTAGEEARVIDGATAKTQSPDVAKTIAWQNQTLVFERTQLTQVAQEFNRYNKMQFRIDPAVGAENRLSGTFDARHPQSFLLWLQSRLDLRVIQQGEVYRVEPLNGM